MIKKLYLGAMFALMLVAGGAVRAQAAPLAAAPVASALVAPLSATLQIPMSATELSNAQLASVHGDGLFSWVKKLFKTVVSKVIGVIVKTIFEAIANWVIQAINSSNGGAEEQKTDTETKNFSSQSNYEANVVDNSSYQEGAWQQTSSWGGGYDGGCGLTDTVGGEQTGDTVLGEEQTSYLMAQMPSC